MKLHIYESASEHKSACGEKEVYLKLVKGLDGRIHVVACDKDGRESTCGYLLSFMPNGKIMRQQGVGSYLGFELNKEGQVKVEK